MNSIIDFIKLLFGALIKGNNLSTPAGERLYYTAKECIGKDIAPTQNIFGCAEAVNNVVFKTFGDYAGGDISTYRMYESLQHNTLFEKVLDPQRGDIILSPTGYGNGTMSNGHVGIISDKNMIMSNSSETGLWTENYTIESWKKKYHEQGGFPVLFYRRIFIS